MSNLADLAIGLSADMDRLEKDFGGAPALVGKTVDRMESIFGGLDIHADMGGLASDLMGAPVVADRASRGVAAAFSGLSAELDADGDSAASAFASAFDSIVTKIKSAGESAADAFGRAFQDVPDKLGKLGKTAGLALGAGAAAGATYGAIEGIQREALADKLGARLFLTETQASTAGSVAGSVYSEGFGESVAHVNTAIAGLISGGMASIDDRGALERLATKALTFADIMEIDVARAAASAGTLISSGLARDADHAFDLMTAGMQRMPLHLQEELLEASDEYSKFFGALGFSGEQTFGLLTTAAEDGMYGIDKMGDSIKEFGILATEVDNPAIRDTLTGIGFDADDMANRLLAGGSTASTAFSEIIDGLLGIEDPAKRTAASVALFGTPLEDLGKSRLFGFLDSLQGVGEGLGDVTGRTEAMTTAYENADGKITTWTRKFEGMLASVVEAPGIIGGTASAVAGLGQVVEPVAPALAGVGFIFKDQLIDGAKGAAKFLGGAGKSLLNVGKDAVVSAGQLAVQTGAMVASKAASLAIAAASKTAAAAQWVLNAALNANPIMIVVTAIAALVAGVIWAYQNVEWFRNIVDGAWSFIQTGTTWLWENILKPIFDQIASIISEVVAPAFRFLWDIVQNVFNWVKENWPLLLAIITGPIGLAVHQIITHWDTIKAGATAVWEWIVEKFNAIRDFILGLPSQIANAATGMWDGIKDAFRGVINWIIRAWNGLQFELPSLDLGPLGSVGGWTVGVPQIPELAKGALVTSPTLAWIGEGRHDEIVAPVPMLRDMFEDMGGGAGQAAAIGAAVREALDGARVEMDGQTVGRVVTSAVGRGLTSARKRAS